MKTLKLEVGKAYRNRKGEEVKIVKNDGIVEYSYEGSDGEWYTENGKWSYVSEVHPKDLIEEVTSETRHTFKIPDGVKEVSVSQVGNRIVVDMVPDIKEPKPGDVMVNEKGSVYIFRGEGEGDSVLHDNYCVLFNDGKLGIGCQNEIGRPATPEEAQPLWDALKKAGKRWNPVTQVVEEEITEIDHIREWVEEHLKDGYYKHEHIALAIASYLEHKEDKK